MKSNEELKVLRAQLDEWNEVVDRAIAARTKWMDEHMADFAKVKVGEELFDGTRYVGIVTEHYSILGVKPKSNASEITTTRPRRK